MISKELRTVGIHFSLLLVVALAPTAALALDDGGGRSVFAYGAGSRALALGGAYVAVADDASAVVWNPGGLGWVQRREFQASHTNLIGLGFSEQFASFVMPSWRYGVASVTFRRFGVGGIEQRDDRNVLLADDLKDNETEIALGYGRPLGRAWSIGWALKMQRHQIAGYNGAGIGFDLGLLVRPLQAAGKSSRLAQALTVGLAVRNAIQPEIRLDEEPVPDPLGLRAGLAYSRPLGANAKLLAALDLEKTQDMESRLHAGLELQLMSRFAFRGGLNDGHLTAGSGIRWRDVQVDYVFEDNELASVHRFGLGFKFGPSVMESRLAARRAEEEALQTRLAEAFEVRNRSRVEGLVAEARSARTERRYDEALEIIGTIAVLDPEHDRLTDLEAACLREKGIELQQAGDYAGAEIMLGQALNLKPDDDRTTRLLTQVRQESDRRAARSTEIRQLFNNALDAFATDELLTARTGFACVLDSDPTDEEAASMLRRTDEAIRHRAASLVDQALAMIQAGQYTQAETLILRATELDARSQNLEGARSRLAAARRTTESRQNELARAAAREQTATPLPGTGGATPAAPGSATPTRPALTAAERLEVEQFYQKGKTAIEAGQVDDAVRYWEFVWSADPQHQRVSEYLKREYLTRGMEAFASGDLHRAVSDWEKVLQIDPEDGRALGYLERAREQQTRIQSIRRENG
ncbi:MAG: PorV/PorQ family protein [bacterium]